MPKMKCYLEIDYFSGRQNPKLEISYGDFEAQCDEIWRLERSSPQSLFDGLGFRGFILSGLAGTIFIQKSIIKINQGNAVEYRKNNPDILSGVFGLVSKYDPENECKTIIEAISKEYL
jgi:hypothetical protein